MEYYYYYYKNKDAIKISYKIDILGRNANEEKREKSREKQKPQD